MKNIIARFRHFPTVLLLFSATIFESCMPENPNQTPQSAPTELPDQKGPSQALLILCDFSDYLDSISVDEVAQHTTNLVHQMSYGSEIRIYPTEENARLPAIFQYLKKKPTRSSEQKEIDLLTLQKATEARKSIFSYFKKSNQETSGNSPRSCIWSNVLTRFDWLHQATDKECKTVVLFSDMYEECAVSPVGSFYMKEKYQKTNEKKVESWQSDRLSGLEKVTVHCVFSSGSYQTRSGGFISSLEAERSWRQIFQNSGFRGELFFQSTLPPKICH